MRKIDEKVILQSYIRSSIFEAYLDFVKLIDETEEKLYFDFVFALIYSIEYDEINNVGVMYFDESFSNKKIDSLVNIIKSKTYNYGLRITMDNNRIITLLDKFYNKNSYYSEEKDYEIIKNSFS